MRSRCPLIAAVLVAALLVGQWLTAAHEPDHALQAGADACAVCVYAHGAGNGALPKALVLALAAPQAAPAAEHFAAPVSVLIRLHPIRGPPALLA